MKNYKIIEKFTLKEKIKMVIGIHDRNNFECYINNRKCRVHLNSSYSITLGKYCPNGYVEVLR